MPCSELPARVASYLRELPACHLCCALAAPTRPDGCPGTTGGCLMLDLGWCSAWPCCPLLQSQAFLAKKRSHCLRAATNAWPGLGPCAQLQCIHCGNRRPVACALDCWRLCPGMDGAQHVGVCVLRCCLPAVQLWANSVDRLRVDPACCVFAVPQLHRC